MTAHPLTELDTETQRVAGGRAGQGIVVFSKDISEARATHAHLHARLTRSGLAVADVGAVTSGLPRRFPRPEELTAALARVGTFVDAGDPQAPPRQTVPCALPVLAERFSNDTWRWTLQLMKAFTRRDLPLLVVAVTTNGQLLGRLYGLDGDSEMMWRTCRVGTEAAAA